MFRYLSIIGCLCYMLSGTEVSAQQLRRLIIGKIHGKDTVVNTEKRYSREGYLLSENYPEIYCGDEWQYDSLGRVISFDHTCGESSSNGITTYEYFPYKIISRGFSAGYTTVTVDSFNVDHLLVLETSWRMEELSLLDRYDTTYIQKEYSYQEHLCVRQVQTTSCSCDSLSSIEVSQYFYDQNDSLVKYTCSGSRYYDPVIIEYIYDSVTHLRMETIFKDTSGNISYRYYYKYDLSGQLIEKEEIEFFTGCMVRWNQYFYKYRKGKIAKEIVVHYEQEPIIDKRPYKSVERYRYYYEYW